MKYRCENCSELFEEPKTIHESHPYGEGSAYEPRNVSPCCQDDYEEAVPCAICGEYPERPGEMEICDECFDNGVRNNFDEYIAECELESDFFLNGDIVCGYAFSADSIVLILKREYKILTERIPDVVMNQRKRYLSDSDQSAFSDWLISRNEAQNAWNGGGKK